MSRLNSRYLDNIELPSNIIGVDSVEEALLDTNLIILAIPAQVIPDWLAQNVGYIGMKTVICNTAKGLYLKGKGLLSDAVRESLGRDQPYAVLSGMSHNILNNRAHFLCTRSCILIIHLYLFY